VPRVFIKRCGDDVIAAVGALLDQAAPDLIAGGERVLIKPNLHAVQHHTTGGTTNPAVVVGIIRWLKARSAGEIIVGDSPYHGNDNPRRTFTHTDMGAAVEAEGVRWVCFEEGPHRLLAGPFDTVAEVHVTERLDWADRIINVPTMKTHFNCLITGALKNLKGLLRKQDKAAFHTLADVSAAVAALNLKVRPHFNLMDATIGMEGMGPGSGEPVGLNLVLASDDAVALDAVAAEVMDIRPLEVNAIRLAAQLGVGEADLSRIEVVGEPIEAVRRRFERPFEAWLRQYPQVSLIGENACSGCQMNVCLALQQAAAGANLGRLSLVMGAADVAPDDAIVVGQCARAHGDGRTFLPGCPPTVERITKAIRARIASEKR
jgi:uncharacterized protein (DUF362 family)